MNRKNKIHSLIFLGTGTSTGIPVVGCSCNVCQSTSSENTRFRSSILVRFENGKTMLVDTTPDLRSQLLINKVSHIDFVLITHAHADHVHGLDDLRPLSFFNGGRPIPLYCDLPTTTCLKEKFQYIFGENNLPNMGGGIPLIDLNPLTLSGPLDSVVLDDIPLDLLSLPHGREQTTSFSTPEMAYLIDCHDVPLSVVDHLRAQKLKFLVIDCVQRKPHRTHLYLEKTLEIIEHINPEKAYLTHLGHNFEHHALNAELSKSSPRTQVAYDRQILNF